MIVISPILKKGQLRFLNTCPSSPGGNWQAKLVKLRVHARLQPTGPLLSLASWAIPSITYRFPDLPFTLAFPFPCFAGTIWSSSSFFLYSSLSCKPILLFAERPSCCLGNFLPTPTHGLALEHLRSQFMGIWGAWICVWSVRPWGQMPTSPRLHQAVDRLAHPGSFPWLTPLNRSIDFFSKLICCQIQVHINI